jgi:hypothetical protein
MFLKVASQVCARFNVAKKMGERRRAERVKFRGEKLKPKSFGGFRMVPERDRN